MHLLWPPELYKAKLFSGIGPEDIDKIVRFLKGKVELFEKGEIITRSLSAQQELCCMLTGSALAFQYDYWGTRSILSSIPTGTAIMAGMLSPQEHLQLDLMANEPSMVLFLDIDDYASHITPPYLSMATNRFTLNLLEQMTKININLMEKDQVLQQRSLRKKIMVFLSDRAIKSESREFTVPLSRQELADYLYVDRCALSHELSRMEKEGIITYHGNHFQLNTLIEESAEEHD